jgi:transposase
MEHMYRTGPLPISAWEEKMVNVGIDLHKTQFTICVRGPKGNGFAKYLTTQEGYQAFLAQAALWQGKGETVRVGVESTGNTRYFKNRMEDAGIGVKVINTLKFKVVNESVNKTDKHDAATIAEFLEKDMLPESKLCSRESEQLRRLLKARQSLVTSEVVMKNQIHALLTAEGMEDVKGSLQSKKGRQRVLDALKANENGLVAQPLIETIERLEENIKGIEKQLRALAEGDRMVELLQTIPGCGEICSWTIRAYTDDINRFANPKKYASFAGLAPWVQNSNETIHHGSITKRGPKELRTAVVQVVMGWRRMKEKTLFWRLMERYEGMKKGKGSGRAIIATARKIAVIIWNMITQDVEFDVGLMVDRKLAKKSASMNGMAGTVQEALNEVQENPVLIEDEKKGEDVKKIVTTAGVASRKRKKVG